MLKVLLIDPAPDQPEHVEQTLHLSYGLPFSLEIATGIDDAVMLLLDRTYDVILLDHALCSASNPHRTQAIIRQAAGKIPIILTSRPGDMGQQQFRVSDTRTIVDKYNLKNQICSGLLDRLAS